MDDLIFQEFDRKAIDKFGKEIDPNKVGEANSQNLPFYS